jgi:hypothetical protein
MGVATGGRRTVVGDFIIPILRRTVALTGATVIILMGHLTMITTRGHMAGMGVRMAPMARPLPVPVTIPTRAHTREAVRSQRPMAAEVQRRRTTRTPGPMPKPDKARVRTLSGEARMSLAETRALPWGIIRPLMEP